MNRIAYLMISLGILYGSLTAEARVKVSTDARFVRIKPLDPHITSDVAGFNRCEGACPGRLVTIYNPTRNAVMTVVRCLGDARTDIMVILKAHETTEVDLYVRGGLRAGDCIIDRWWRRPAK